MRILLAALLAFLLFGCIGAPVPSNCQGLQADDFARCIYFEAVSEQNPSYCYHIADLDQRKICLRDAIEPSAKAALSRATPQQKEQLFSTPPAEPKPAALPELTERQPECQTDECISQTAITQLNISACKAIKSQSARDVCIYTIARKTKNLSLCDSFEPGTKEADLCKSYAKGDLK
ncbi:MAG: hypothetical protein N3G80_03830 [Candidatus Micrarchaeota archaeon]|nr:hypothetical protein [Candidatus Micrarchaeota archaeon]